MCVCKSEQVCSSNDGYMHIFTTRFIFHTQKKWQFYKILLKHIIVDRVNIVCTTYTNIAMHEVVAGEQML